jgi:hypothetical protein
VVLAQRVGKKRSFWRGLLLTVATLGLYAIYWNYRAHNEVYKQFELAKEGRDEGVLWYVLGLVLVPFLAAFAWTMVSNVQYVRDRMRLPRSLSPARFVTLFSLGVGAYLAAVIFIVALDATGQISADPENVTEIESLASTLLLAGIGVFLATVPFAYYRLQKDINDLWDAYDRRVLELSAPAVAAAAARSPAAPAAAPAAGRYLADLAPPPPSPPEEPRP